MQYDRRLLQEQLNELERQHNKKPKYFWEKIFIISVIVIFIIVSAIYVNMV